MNSNTARKDVAEELLLEPVRREILADEAVQHALRMIRELLLTEKTQQQAAAATEVSRLRSQITELERLIAAGVLSPDVGRAAIDQASRERSALLSRRAPPREAACLQTIAFRAEAAYRQAVAHLGQSLEGPDLSAARELLKPLIGVIRCRPAESSNHLIAELGLNRAALLKAGNGDWDGSGGALSSQKLLIPLK